MYDPGAGDPPLFKIRKMGSRCHIDLIRPNVRSRLTEGERFSTGRVLKSYFKILARILLTMQMESDAFNALRLWGVGP